MFGRLPWQKPEEPPLVLGQLGSLPFMPPITMPQQQRAAHMYVIGLSGKGKSKFLEHCLYQDIAAGRGAGLVDPHSLLADDLLRLLVTKKLHLDPRVQEKLIYVDPARQDYIVPFNVLALPQEEPYDIAATVLEAFRRTWPESLKEAPHFANIVMASLLALIENRLTLMHLSKLLTNKDFREQCLTNVADQSVIEYFHDRYDKWGREAPILRESILNKVGAFSLNPRLKLMLGQPENHLDFCKIMDEGKILILDLGHCDGETNRLIGSLVVTGLELAMRRRRKRYLWNLTIDEFSGYVANEGSTKTLSHVFSEGRKFGMSMTVAHQDLSQLSPRLLGALSNVQTKVIFEVGRADAEYFARLIGKVDTEAIKREPKTEHQYELFSALPEQWEEWTKRLQFQANRHAYVAMQTGKVIKINTIRIPEYTAIDSQVEQFKQESIKSYGIASEQAIKSLSNMEFNSREPIKHNSSIPAFEFV